MGIGNNKAELTQRPKTANKRTREEIEQHRIFVIEKLQQGYTHEEIRDLLEEKTGISLSRGQISYDIRAVREGWRTKQLDTYEAYVNEELAWLDMFERQLWGEYRKSSKSTSNEKIEQVMQEAIEESDGDDELAIAKITTYVNNNNAGDPRLLKMILETRQDRRKILGLYAPSKAVVRMEHVKADKVKGFVDVSPDDWDEPIDGEYTEAD